MSPHQALAIAVRLFALWLFVFALVSVGSFVAADQKMGGATALLFTLVCFVFIAFVCFLIWSFPQVIAHKLLPKSVADAPHDKTFDSWFNLGCSLIGVWVLSKAIPSLAHFFTLNYLGFELYGDSFSMRPNWKLELSFDFFYLCYGFWLLLGARGLKKLVTWARNA
jgi:hypothetical protein